MTEKVIRKTTPEISSEHNQNPKLKFRKDLESNMLRLQYYGEN